MSNSRNCSSVEWSTFFFGFVSTLICCLCCCSTSTSCLTTVGCDVIKRLSSFELDDWFDIVCCILDGAAAMTICCRKVPGVWGRVVLISFGIWIGTEILIGAIIVRFALSAMLVMILTLLCWLFPLKAVNKTLLPLLAINFPFPIGRAYNKLLWSADCKVGSCFSALSFSIKLNNVPASLDFISEIVRVTFVIGFVSVKLTLTCRDVKISLVPMILFFSWSLVVKTALPKAWLNFGSTWLLDWMTVFPIFWMIELGDVLVMGPLPGELLMVSKPMSDTLLLVDVWINFAYVSS